MNDEEMEKVANEIRQNIKRDKQGLMKDAEFIQKSAIIKTMPTSCIPVVKGYVRRDRKL